MVPVFGRRHLAHRLCAFKAARIGNIVDVEWKEFSLDASPIPREKMKISGCADDHGIPLLQPIADAALCFKCRR